MKKIFTFIAVLFFPFLLSAQIRNYVGVVKEQYHPKIISFLEDFKESLSNNGYSTYAKYIDAYLEGGFGSGFVYVDSVGNNYIITNRHVVSQAVTASIEFEDDTSDTMKKYEGLTVVALDEDIDLAVLKFKDNAKPFKSGIPISTATLRDGQDVWSAGFPGLGGEPLWQLGKGTITNSKAKVKELLDPSISAIIQHSAEVDGGNSGGPLLITSRNSIGYEVIGINTWKATSRQNTNFAIPASLINTMIKKINSNNSINDLTTIEAKSNNFIEILNNEKEDFTSIAKFISDELTLQRGKDDFIATVRYASSTDRGIVADAFSYSPLEGLRYSVAYQLWKKYSVSSNSGKTLSINSSQLKSDLFETSITIEGSTSKINTTWINEKSIWKIKSFVTDDKKEDKQEKAKSKLDDSKPKSKSPVRIKPITYMHVNAGVGFNSQTFSFDSLTASIDMWAFGYFGVNMLYTNLYPFSSLNVNAIAGGLDLRLPIEINRKVSLEFNGKVNFGVIPKFGSSDKIYKGLYAEGGVNFIFLDFLEWKPGFGVSYSLMSLSESFDDTNKIKLNDIKIYGIVAF